MTAKYFQQSKKYQDNQLKLQLLESGWTLNEINNTDLDELIKLYAFRDAVQEFNDIKYLDENTMF